MICGAAAMLMTSGTPCCSATWAIAVAAIQLGFCAKIDGLDKSQLYPAALFKDDKAVAVGQTGTGFMINTKTFKDKGWATPTS